MPPDLTIDVAERKDAEAILRLQRLAFRSEAEFYQDWTIPALTESLGELLAEFDRQLFLKAFCDRPECVVGSARTLFDGGTCSICRLIVHPDYQHRGIGTMLMREIENRFPRARRFELFTGHRSSGNLSFYRRLGYVPSREQRLTDRVTLVLLEKTVVQQVSGANPS